jgi:hypothetical protein
MGSFPALPSGNNPALGAAAGYASSAASAYNAMQSAKNQQAIRDQQRKDKAAADYQAGLQRDFQDQLELLKMGAVPTQVYPNGPPLPGRPTLQSPEANPAAQGGGPTITDPQGNRQYIPTESEKDLRSGKTFIPTGGLASALIAGGAWDGITPMTAAHSHDLLMSLNEAQPKGDGWELDTSGKMVDANGNPAAFWKNKNGKIMPFDGSGTAQSGQPGGGTPGAAPGGPFDLSSNGYGPNLSRMAAQPGAAQPAQGGGGLRFAPAEKPEKPDVSQIVPGQVGPNGGLLIYDKNTQSMKEIPPIPGSKGVLTADQEDRSEDRKVRLREAEARLGDAATAREARQADAQQARENQAAQNHEAAGLKKQAMQAMAQAYHDAATTPSNGTYYEPRYVNGVVVSAGQPKTMPDDPQQRDDEIKRLKTLAKGYEQTAKTHQDEQERIEKARGWGKYAAPQTAPAPPAPPAQRGAAPAAKGTAGTNGKQPVTMQHIRNYVQAKRAEGNPNFSEADAIREFKSYGYPIGK